MPETNERHLVLISAGVGITPMMSMLKAHLCDRDPKDITFIHCAENSDHHCFFIELKELQRQYNFNLFSIYTNDDSGDHKGFINQTALQRFISDWNADYYFCGPFPFMVSIKELLLNEGVDEGKLNYEVFGPTLTLVA